MAQNLHKWHHSISILEHILFNQHYICKFYPCWSTQLIHSDFCIVFLNKHDTIYLSNILYLSCFYISIITNNAGMNTLYQSTHLGMFQGGAIGRIHLHHHQMLAKLLSTSLKSVQAPSFHTSHPSQHFLVSSDNLFLLVFEYEIVFHCFYILISLMKLNIIFFCSINYLIMPFAHFSNGLLALFSGFIVLYISGYY